MNRPSFHQRNSGFAAITAIILVLVMGVMAVTLFSLTNTELAVGKASSDSTVGFYAAEAGLNVRGEQVRNIFIGYNRPDGESTNDCNANPGSGSYACQEITVGSRNVVTKAEESTCSDGDSDGTCDRAGGELLPQVIVIPQGDTFGGLSAQEYTYTVASDAYSPQGELEARLGMRFRSRLVPLFQFAAFFDQDLELSNGPAMTLGGRVHSNGNIYFGPHRSLTIDGKITTAENLMLGRKPGDHQERNRSCGGTVDVRGANGQFVDVSADNNCSADEITADNLRRTGGNIQQDVPPLEIPKVGVIDRDPDDKEAVYWQKADLRIVLNLSLGIPRFEVRGVDDNVNVSLTGLLNGGGTGCAGSVEYSDTFYNRREQDHIEMLNVDMQTLLACMDGNPAFPDLDDDTEGGLVMHFSVDGPDSDGINSYGVRLKNGADLNDVQGLTVVTDQALYVQGDYNSVNKKPASLLADSLNALSNDWCDTRDSRNDDECLDEKYPSFRTRAQYAPYNEWYERRGLAPRYLTAQPYNDQGLERYRGDEVRQADDTTINAAMMANVDETGITTPDRNGNTDRRGNGGLHNFPRMHENWGGEALRIRGSFVSLGTPQHVNGKWSCCGNVYSPPTRDWDYDTDFNVASNLPPLSPRFVILVQEVFSRDYTPEAGANQ